MKKIPPAEFYDLSERILNSGDAYWGNLGYWQQGSDYSCACESLARVLASAVELNADSRVLDVGFGCGDQLLLWLQDYHLQFLCGINYSISQTELAQQRLRQSGNLTVAGNIHQGDISDLSNYALPKDASINTILALDCAYHFSSRQKFFRDSYHLLQEKLNGRIGLTDIVLARNHLSRGKRLLLNVMLRLSRIPQHNIVSLEEYKNQLQQAGFSLCDSQDISEYVFEPFGNWLSSSQERLKRIRRNRSAWLKYKLTATFLSWAYRAKVLRYIVITAKVH